MRRFPGSELKPLLKQPKSVLGAALAAFHPDPFADKGQRPVVSCWLRLRLVLT